MRSITSKDVAAVTGGLGCPSDENYNPWNAGDFVGDLLGWPEPFEAIPSA